MNIDIDKPWRPGDNDKSNIDQAQANKIRTNHVDQGIPLKPLTRKQKAFADHLLNNPKTSGTQAALATYDTISNGTAAIISHENLSKPNVQAYLESQADIAGNSMIEVLQMSKQFAKTGTREGASYAAVSVTAARDILDRVLGKPTQRTEVTSKNISVSIDLTSST